MLKQSTLVNTMILIMVFSVTACTNKTVYLFNTGYTQAPINKVTEQLILLGYDVKHVDAEIPAEFSDTAISTHPIFNQPDDLVQLEHILSALGFPRPKFYQFAQGNHFYQAESIGLYLREGEQYIIPPVMGSHNCGNTDATLEFFKTGDVKLEIEIYIDGEYVEGSHKKYSGKYILEGKNIQFNFVTFKTQLLPITETMVPTYLGERRAERIVFKSVSNNSGIEHCLFEAIYE